MTAVIRRQDLTQIKKDIERISLHPILRGQEVRAQVMNSLLSFLASSACERLSSSSDSTASSVSASVNYI